MIVLACTALASVGASVFIAVKKSTTAPARVNWQTPTRTSKVEEVHLLNSFLAKEIDRVKKQKPEQREDIVHVLAGIRAMIHSAWKLNSYYGKKNLASFLRTIAIIEEMPNRPSPTDRYLETLRNLAVDISRECSALLIRNENGDDVTDTTYHANDAYRIRNRELESRVDEMFKANLKHLNQ